MTRELWMVHYEIVATQGDAVPKPGFIFYDMSYVGFDEAKVHWSKVPTSIASQLGLGSWCDVILTNCVLLKATSVLVAPPTVETPQIEEQDDVVS